MLLNSFLTLFSQGSVEREFSERAVRVAASLDDRDNLRGEVLGLAVSGFGQVGQADRAAELAPQAIEAAALAGRDAPVMAYQGWGQALYFSGETEAAEEVHQLLLDRLENESPRWETTVTKMSIGGWRTDEVGGPDDLSNVAVTEAEAAGSDIALAMALVARSGRQPTEALAIADLERANSLAGGDQDVVIWSTLGLARAAHRAGDSRLAAERYVAAIKDAIEHAKYYIMTIGLANFSVLAAEVGVTEGVASLFSSAQEMERRSGGTVRGTWSDDLETLETLERRLADLSIAFAEPGPPLDDRQVRRLINEVAARITG